MLTDALGGTPVATIVALAAAGTAYLTGALLLRGPLELHALTALRPRKRRLVNEGTP